MTTRPAASSRRRGYPYEENALSKSPKQTQEQAEARFKRKDQQARDASSAMAEYEASQAAVRKKTERLRALRLAKEAEDAKAAAEAPVVEKKGAKKKKS